MALLRRGSSRISEANFNVRLQREKAKSGAVTASLAWNDPSDLDLQAYVYLASGDGVKNIYFGNKKDAGGELDVDMHERDGELVDEPVENIYWKKPPAGVYSIKVSMYKKRGTRGESIPFRAMLKREDEEPLSVEGAVTGELGKKEVECFRFIVDDDGEVNMQKVGTPLPPYAAAQPMRVAPRPRAKAKAKAKPSPMKRVSTVARGKHAKRQIFKGEKLKTRGGLRKEDLKKNKKGVIVSIKKSQQGQKSKWNKAMQKAREAKGYKGFKKIKKGTSFYEKAKQLMSEL